MRKFSSFGFASIFAVLALVAVLFAFVTPAAVVAQDVPQNGLGVTMDQQSADVVYKGFTIGVGGSGSQWSLFVDRPIIINGKSYRSLDAARFFTVAYESWDCSSTTSEVTLEYVVRIPGPDYLNSQKVFYNTIGNGTSRVLPWKTQIQKGAAVQFSLESGREWMGYWHLLTQKQALTEGKKFVDYATGSRW